MMKESDKVRSKELIEAASPDGKGRFDMPVGTTGEVLYFQDPYVVIGLDSPFSSLFNQLKDEFDTYWEILDATGG